MKVYTDGSCRRGIGGWAWWCPETKESDSGSEDVSSNQRMELRAALEAVSHFYEDPNLMIISDSAYLVNCFGEKWWVKWLESGWISSTNRKIVNRDIWEPLLEMVRTHGRIKFVWVKGHSGNAGNNKADELAFKAVEARENEMQSGVKPVLVEKPLEVGRHICAYCEKKPVTHFFLFNHKNFIGTCEEHTTQARIPLLLSESFDEHPWGEGCNATHSSWTIPIEKNETSWCMEVH